MPVKPPPPPRRPPPPPVRTNAGKGVTEAQRHAISVEALGLLSEQLTARVVHYRADLQTNSELDAITAHVVAHVRAMQDVASSGTASNRSAESLEEEQIGALSGLIKRLLGPRGGTDFVTHWIGPVGKRVAKLFFESELHERTRGDKERLIRSSAQGVYYALARYSHRLKADLESFDYEDDEVRGATLERLERIAVELRTEFLSKRSPELHRVMGSLSEVLTEFLQGVVAERRTLAERVIRQAQTARQAGAVGYKIARTAFEAFRAAWETEWVERWVAFASDRFVSSLQASDEPFLQETIAFFTDPHLYSETALVLCEAVYDFLCQEGFLDLPLDWRVSQTVRS